MKISQELRPILDKRKVETRQTSNDKSDFRTLLVKEGSQLHKDRLNELLSDIAKQGDRLARSQTVKELHQYKRLIERFVKEAVEFGMELKHTGGWSLSGRMESHTLVEKIDEELLALTEMVLDEGKGSLDLLGKIGEIEGLLINLYT